MDARKRTLDNLAAAMDATRCQQCGTLDARDRTPEGCQACLAPLTERELDRREIERLQQEVATLRRVHAAHLREMENLRRDVRFARAAADHERRWAKAERLNAIGRLERQRLAHLEDLNQERARR